MRQVTENALTVYGEAALHVITDAAPAPEPALGRVEVVLGGPAATVSLQSALLGHPPMFIGVCGDDEAGDMARRRLVEHGVDCSRLSASGHTTRVVAVHGEGRTDLMAEPGASWGGSPWSDDPPEPLGGLAYVTAFPEMTPAIQALGRRGHRLVADVGFIPLLRRPRELLAHVAAIAEAIDICVVSAAGLDEPTVDALARLCLGQGARAVLATRAAEGVVVITANGRKELPAYPVHAVDSLCAGDTFVAGVLCGLAEGANVIEAADFGQAVAAAKVARFAALPSRADAERLRAAGK